MNNNDEKRHFNVVISKKIWVNFKKMCVEQEISMREGFEDAIENYLKKRMKTLEKNKDSIV